MDEQTQLIKNQRRKLRKQEAAELRESQKRKRVMKKYAIWIFILAVVAAVIFGLINLNEQPAETGLVDSEGTAQVKSKDELQVESIPIQGRDHISENTPTPTYNSNPPTSGPHARPVSGGFHRSEVKDINAIHNLEHGFIWITYKNVDDETLATLKDIGRRFSGSVVVSPREANDSPIALASWGRLAKIDVDAFDEEVAIDFIRKYKNKSPERLAR